MKTFILGFAAAVALSVTLYFYAPPAFLNIRLGQILDQDAIQMKTGDVIYGRIVRETPDTIYVEMNKGAYSLSRGKCASIQRNVTGRYFRDLP